MQDSTEDAILYILAYRETSVWKDPGGNGPRPGVSGETPACITLVTDHSTTLLSDSLSLVEAWNMGPHGLCRLSLEARWPAVPVTQSTV